MTAGRGGELVDVVASDGGELVGTVASTGNDNVEFSLVTIKNYLSHAVHKRRSFIKSYLHVQRPSVIMDVA